MTQSPPSLRKVPDGNASTDRPPAVRVTASAPIGLLVLGLLLALGPAARTDSALDGGTVLWAGLLAAGAAFAALTLAEALTAWRARLLGLAAGPVVVSGWGPTISDAEQPRSWQQARRLGRFKPLVTFASGLSLLLLAAAAAGAAWTPLASALVGAALLTSALAVLDLLPGPGRSGGLLVLARNWQRSDRLTGEQAVARAGVRTGWTLVALGFVAILAVGPVGLWFSLIGWLTLVHSRIEQARTALRAATAELPARAAMTPGAPEVTGWHTVDAVLAEVGRTPHQVLPLRRFDGSLHVVLTADLFAVPGDDRDLKRAQDFARPAVQLAPDQPVQRLLDAAQGVAAPIGLVVENDVVLGVIGPAELARLLATATAPGSRPHHVPWQDRPLQGR